MIDIANTPINKLPNSPTQEMIDSGMNLYDYRKPEKYLKEMMSFEELKNIINNGDYTLRQLIYEVSPHGHIYYFLEGSTELSPYALSWCPGFCELTEKGEKRFKKLLDSEVILHDQGVLYIRYKNKSVMDTFAACFAGVSHERGNLVWY